MSSLIGDAGGMEVTEADLMAFWPQRSLYFLFHYRPKILSPKGTCQVVQAKGVVHDDGIVHAVVVVHTEGIYLI